MGLCVLVLVVVAVLVLVSVWVSVLVSVLVLVSGLVLVWCDWPMKPGRKGNVGGGRSVGLAGPVCFGA